MPDGPAGDTERRLWHGPHPATIAARLALLVLVGTLSVVATRDGGTVIWALLLTVASIPALLAPRHPVLGPLTRCAEVLIVCLATDVVVANATDTGIGVAAVLPYLAVPVVSAGLYLRRVETALLLALG